MKRIDELIPLAGSAKRFFGHLSDEELAKQGYVRTQEQIKTKQAEVEYWENINKQTPLEFSRDQKWIIFRNELNQQCHGFWEFTDENTEIIQNLFRYFNNEPGEYDLNKGIYIQGMFGVGKTSILKALLEVPFKKMGYLDWKFNRAKQTSCFRIISEYDLYSSTKEPGYQFEQKYCQGEWYFDDFGSEPKPKYAKAVSTPFIGSLIEFKYHHNKTSKLYITSNLSIEMVGETYGYRVESRLKEMCNFITLDGKDFRTK